MKRKTQTRHKEKEFKLAIESLGIRAKINEGRRITISDMSLIWDHLAEIFLAKQNKAEK